LLLAVVVRSALFITRRFAPRRSFCPSPLTHTLQNNEGGHSDDQLRDWFRKIDKTGKGVIEPQDLMQFMKRLSDGGGVFLEDLETDPDACVADRTIDWSEKMNNVMIDAKGLLGKDDVRKSEKSNLEGITFENFKKIVEELDM